MKNRERSCSLQHVSTSSQTSGSYSHMIGAAIHITPTRPPRMFIAAQNGVINGEPMYAICAQSKVTGNNPRPDEIPNYSG